MYSQVRHVAILSKHPIFQLIYLIWTEAPEKNRNTKTSFKLLYL